MSEHTKTLDWISSLSTSTSSLFFSFTGRKTHTTDNVSINKNMGAENRQCSDAVQANEEDGVFYTSINFAGIRKAKVSLFKSFP